MFFVDAASFRGIYRDGLGHGKLQAVPPISSLLQVPTMDEHAARLRATIAEREQELRSVSEVDPETRAMLQEAVEEIQGTLRTSNSDATTEPHSLNERLNIAAAPLRRAVRAGNGFALQLVDVLEHFGHRRIILAGNLLADLHVLV